MIVKSSMVKGILLLGAGLSVLATASAPQAQERLSMRRLKGPALTPLLEREVVGGLLRPDFADRGKRHVGLEGWGGTLGLAGVVEESGEGAGGPTLEPRAVLLAAGRPSEALTFEADAQLALPDLVRAPTNDPGDGEARAARGLYSAGGLYSLGEGSGLDLKLGLGAAHGDDPARMAHSLDVGPGVFFDGELKAAARPWVAFSKEHTYALQFEFNTRQVLYGGQEAPLSGFHAEEVAGGLAMCFEEFGPARCLQILRYTYSRTKLERGSAPRATGALTAEGRPTAMDRYDVHSIQVGFIDAPMFGDFGFYGFMSPTWIWDAGACTFFDEGGLSCEGEGHENRRAGWMMGGGVGVEYATEEWALGLGFENRPGHSPDGALLGSIQRVETGVAFEHPEARGLGVRLQGALEHFWEIYCQECLEGAPPPVDPENFKDNEMIRLNLGADMHVDLEDDVRLGLGYDALFGTRVDERSWAIDEDQRQWRHEVSAYLSWRP